MVHRRLTKPWGIGSGLLGFALGLFAAGRAIVGAGGSAPPDTPPRTIAPSDATPAAPRAIALEVAPIVPQSTMLRGHQASDTAAAPRPETPAGTGGADWGGDDRPVVRHLAPEPLILASATEEPAIIEEPLELAVHTAQEPVPPEPRPPGNLAPPVPPAPTPEPPALEPLDDRPNAGIQLRIDQEDFRRAFELLGTQAGVNFVVSPGVTGTVTMNLRNLTFEQAMDVLLKTGNLAVRKENGLIFVYTAAEMEAMEAKGRQLQTRVFPLNYVRAADVAVLIRPFLSRGGSLSLTPSSGGAGNVGFGAGGGGVGGLTAGGGGGGGQGGGGFGSNTPPISGANISAGSTVNTGADVGGNALANQDTIIIRDYPDNMATIEGIIAELDVQPMQVLIEAVILSVALDDSQSLGINFSVVDKLDKLAFVSGNGGLIDAAAGFKGARVLGTTAATAPFVAPRPGQLISGYLGADQGVKFGFISDNVGGFVQNLESMNKVNILASPRILVLNKQRAEIQLGQRLGYRNSITTLTISQQTVNFLTVGTLLSLRPFVSNDGMIRMEIHPEKSSGFIDLNQVPQANTTELTTNILVPDGVTLVIGGLIDSNDTGNMQGPIGLNRLPLVGPLFRNQSQRSQKTELIVLLTPRIIHRNALPPPGMGVAPMGPSGIPNSGPMPGAPYMPGLQLPPEGLPALPMEPIDSWLGLMRSTTSEPVKPSGRVLAWPSPVQSAEKEKGDEAPFRRPRLLRSPQSTGTAAAAPAATGLDQTIRPVRFQAVPPSPVAAPESAPAPTPPAPAARPKAAPRPYRPGDITRSLFGKLQAPKEKEPGPPPTSVTSARPRAATTPPEAPSGLLRTAFSSLRKGGKGVDRAGMPPPRQGPELERAIFEAAYPGAPLGVPIDQGFHGGVP